MFRKKVKVKPGHTQSTKDRQFVVQSLSENYFPELAETFLKSFPNLVKSHVEGTNIVVYFYGKDPILFTDGTSKTFYPTIYAVQMLPEFAQRSLTVKEGVEEFIFNGADLMWPGVRNVEALPNYLHEQLVVVKDYMGESVAVGRMACDVAIVKTATQKKGKAVKVLHYLGDELWNAGSGLDKSAQIIEEKKVEEQKEEIKKQPIVEEEVKTIEAEPEAVKEEEKKPLEEDKGVEPEKKPEESEEYKMDVVIYQAFMNALKLSVKDTDLPMEPSTLANVHMKTCTTQPFNFRASSYKRIGKFLDEMKKRGIIHYATTKDVKDHARILSVSRSNVYVHPQNNPNNSYKSFQPTIEKPLEAPPAGVEEEKEGLPNVRITVIYQPKEAHKFLFTGLEAKNTYPKEQVINLFLEYAKSHSLLDKSGKHVIQLDPNLGQLIKSSPKTEGKVKITLDNALKEYLDTYRQFLLIEVLSDDTIVRTSVVRLTEEPIITLTAARAFNKKVTIVQGADKIQIDLDELLKYLKSKLAASGTVQESKIGTGKEVMVQGKHLDAIKKIFVEGFGLPEKQVKLVDKIGDTKKKGKKKH